MYLRSVRLASACNGFCLVGYVSPDMGETFEAIYHPAVFQTQHEANRFAEVVRHKPIDLNRWIVTGLPNSTYCLQRDPSENPGYYSPVRRRD